MPWAKAASPAFSAGTKSRFTPRRSAARAMGRAPCTGRSSPVRESSPIKAQSSPGLSNSPRAERIPTSMGKSYTVPAFFLSAGARFTVMRLTGKEKPLFFMAALTRSRASFTAASGRPTISKPGRPLEIYTSTATG